MRLLAAALGLAMTGCVAPLPAPPQPQYREVWNHPQMPSMNFYQDNSQCMAMGQSVQPAAIGGAPGYADPYNQAYVQTWNQLAAEDAMRSRDQIYTQCMMGKGYFLDRERVQ